MKKGRSDLKECLMSLRISYLKYIESNDNQHLKIVWKFIFLIIEGHGRSEKSIDGVTMNCFAFAEGRINIEEAMKRVVIF